MGMLSFYFLYAVNDLIFFFLTICVENFGFSLLGWIVKIGLLSEVSRACTTLSIFFICAKFGILQLGFVLNYAQFKMGFGGVFLYVQCWGLCWRGWGQQLFSAVQEFGEASEEIRCGYLVKIRWFCQCQLLN